MADTERPSPFTIPELAFKFAVGPSSEPRPSRSMTVGNLIHNLAVFADFYERASADIDREEGVTKPWSIGNRDANADVMQRDFQATVAIDRVRAYVLALYGADLTIGTARRLLGDLIRRFALTVKAAEELLLEEAMDKLDAAESRGNDAGILESKSARAGDEKNTVPPRALRTPAQLLEAFASAAAKFPACPRMVAFLNSAREDGLVTVPSSFVPRKADGQPVVGQLNIGGSSKSVFGSGATFYGIGGARIASERGSLNVGFVLYGSGNDEAATKFRELGNEAGVVVHVHDLVRGIQSYDWPLVLWSLIVYDTLQGSAWLSQIDGITENPALHFNPFAASVETMKRLLARNESLIERHKEADSGRSPSFEGEHDPTAFPMIPIASDVPDLGKADTIPELWQWCNQHRDGLRQFRVRLGEPEPASVAVDEFRVIPEIVHQCRNYLHGFGAEEIPEDFTFPALPSVQTPTGPENFPSPMECFLSWASGYRAPRHGLMQLIGEVEKFLTWAMAWCRQQQGRTEGEGEHEPTSRNGSSQPTEECLFAPSGNGYFIKGFGEYGHLGGYKGLDVIARLIRTPGELVSMLELVGADDRTKADRRSPQRVLDADAKKKIREELQERRADLEQARKKNNTVEADLAEADVEKLQQQLLQAEGLHGKDRDLNNPFEKLRPQIHGQLKTVYKAMRKADPQMTRLAEHFDLSISSEGGTGFIYRPAAGSPPWQFQRDPQK
jgi:hypothetical protein